MSLRITRWKQYGFGVSLVVSVSVGVDAGSVYKSVDDAGNVSYSSAPAARSAQTQPIAVPPPPSDSQREEAQRIQTQINSGSTSTVSDLERLRQERRQQVEQAEANLQRARQNLERVEVQKDDDWQNLAQGGRHLKESYFQRVEAAEQAVKAAEQELARARRDLR
jgi:regulator of PEP synthase PpsR (kinase-PPPase family)